MSRINNLGDFPDIQDVWKKYPNGGKEGDFLTIAGVTYEWNKYERLWENSASVTESPARPMESVEGDLSVMNDFYLGGRIHCRNGELVPADLYVPFEEIDTLHDCRKDTGVYRVTSRKGKSVLTTGMLVVIGDGMAHGVHQLLYTRSTLPLTNGINHTDHKTYIYERAYHEPGSPGAGKEGREGWTPWVNRIPDDLVERFNRTEPVVLQGFVEGISEEITSITNVDKGPEPTDLLYSKDSGEVVWRRLDGPRTNYHSFWTTKDVNGTGSDRYNDPETWKCYIGKIYIIAGNPHIYTASGMKKIITTDI